MNNIIENEFPKIWDDLTNGKNITTQINPLGIVLGGTPGAGKSILIAKAEKEMNRNIISINGDDFRIYHPNFKEIFKQYGADFPKYTSEFSNKMVEKVIHEAKKQKFNLIVEGTFRRSDTPIKTLSELKEYGYKTKAMILVTNAEIAWNSTIERYNKDIESGFYARTVDRNHFDEVVGNLAQNVKTVLDSGKADQLIVYSRNKLLFDSKTDDKEKILQIINDKLNVLNKDLNLRNNTENQNFNEKYKIETIKNIKMKF